MKDNAVWFLTGALIMLLINLTIFNYAKQLIIKDCLDTNYVTINETTLYCKVDISKFKGKLKT